MSDVEYSLEPDLPLEEFRRTHAAAGLNTHLILLAAPKAETYYPHIGMRHHHSCRVIPRE